MTWKEMPKLTLMLMLMLTVGTAWAFDPPRIIGHLTASAPSVDDFATDFVCVGDQNGDGFDDLLVNHGTWRPRQGDRDFSNRVELYFGGNPMDSIPDFVVSGPQRGPVMFGRRINNIGRLTDSENPWIAIQLTETTGNHRIANHRIYIYEFGNAIDDNPEFSLNSPLGYDLSFGIGIGFGRRNNPSDYNGDSFSDLIVGRLFLMENNTINSQLEAYFGGDQFDTIPEWKVILNEVTISSLDFSSGYDVNRDGYDDFILRLKDSEAEYKIKYSLYLGGDPMDTVAVWEFYEDRFQDTLMNRGFAMVPDVNGDGYDDWVIHYWIDDENDPTYRQGYYLFYGSRNPDSDYDFRLDGAPSAWGADGEVIGGDVNGDGFGDIIMTNPNGYADGGIVKIIFGSRWFSENNSLSVNCRSRYGDNLNFLGTYVGAIGDYNEDNIFDFLTHRIGGDQNFGPASAILFAGSRLWAVTVQEKIQQQKDLDLTLSTTPNPFNSRVTITVNIPASGELCVEVFDTQGRLVAQLEHPPLIPPASGGGKYTFDWLAPSAGVYLVAVTSDRGEKVVKKAVCLR